MNYNDQLAHHHEVGRNYMLTEGLEHGNYGMQTYGREFDSFNDMVSALHHRPAQVDEFFSDPSAFLHQRELNTHHMEDRFLKNEHTEFVDHGENAHNYQLKSFMDTQSMFRDALKRGTHVSYSNSNNSGFRKGSIDLF